MLSLVFQTTVCIPVFLIFVKLLIESVRIERSNDQLSDLDLIPTRNGARQGCPFSPLLSLFILDIPKLLNWSNTWHISNQLPTVCYQPIVVYLAYRLMTKVMVFTNSVSWPDIQPLILNNKQIETVKEYIWEYYLHKMESLQGPAMSSLQGPKISSQQHSRCCTVNILVRVAQTFSYVCKYYSSKCTLTSQTISQIYYIYLGVFFFISS